MGRAIRRLVSLYESLDDLLQAADDHATNENEEDDETELLTEEALEKQQEYANVYLFCLTSSKRLLGLKVALQRLRFSYRYFRQLGRQLKTPLPTWICI